VPAPPVESALSEEGAGNEVVAAAKETTQTVAARDKTEREAEAGETAEEAPLLPEPVLGIVQLFDPGSRRAARRSGEPYQVVANVAPGEVRLEQGLRLRVEGQLASFPDGRAVACSSVDPDRPPLCFILARFERIAITDAAGARVYAQWAR
jgi:hypothetical protein